MVWSANQQMNEEKGCIDIEHAPTVCEQCNTLLAMTFILKDSTRISFHVLCDHCFRYAEDNTKAT